MAKSEAYYNRLLNAEKSAKEQKDREVVQKYYKQRNDRVNNNFYDLIQMEGIELKASLNEAIEILISKSKNPERVKKVLYHRYVLGQSYIDAAADIGVSHGTVRLNDLNILRQLRWICYYGEPLQNKTIVNS